MKKRLAIISSHPIQYNAPLYKLLNERAIIELKVFYTWGQAKNKIYDPGFGEEREWDIPLLEGYNYEFIENVSKNPGSHHFKGIINPTLIKKIKDYKPDAILIFGWAFNSHLKVLRHFKNKIPIWFRGDSNLIDKSSEKFIKKIIRNIFLRWVFSHVDKALYVGSANKDYFLACGLSQKQIVFAPHAIDNVRFADISGDYDTKAKKWRCSLGIKDTDQVFLFAGKLEPKKNPSLLIETFSKMLKPDIHLIIVGNGILEIELKKQFSGIKNFHFIDFQNQSLMPVIYRLGDTFVLPSKGPGETWGLAINEAMACGRSIIVSNKCGCANDLVFANKNGYIFNSNDLTDLFDKMEMIITQKDRTSKMGSFSLEIIKDWNFENICKVIEKSFA